MCGIAGIIYRNGSLASQEVVKSMCDKIVHRGPDDEGYFVTGSLAMGMRRLSVIDLSSGRQPISNEDGTITVVFNGEIYNYRDLRTRLESEGHQFATNSDTEVLVHGYEAWGTDLPKRLNGMFAFSLWDSKNRKLFIARDHVGIKPLYVYQDREKIAWGSEIKSVLEVPGIAREVDHFGMFDFLRFGYVPAPRTMFKGIQKISPATSLVIQEGKINSQSYWSLEYPEKQDSSRSIDSYGEELRSLLNDSVSRQMMSDVPLGAFLSGGLDSSSIVATMSDLGVEHISTYAIGFGAEDAFHSELEKAKGVANQFGTDHHEIVVEPDVASLIKPLMWHLDEPFTDTSFLVTYLVSKLARETVTVIQSGMGGDEIFGGYRRYLGAEYQKWVDLVPRTVRRNVLEPVLNRLPVDRGSSIKSLFRYARRFISQADLTPPYRYQGYVGVFDQQQRRDVLSPSLAELEAAHHGEHVAEYYETAPANTMLDRMLYADLKTSLVDSLLTFTDKMTMAVSLEARVPLLDTRLIEFAATVPPQYKLNGKSGMKRVLKHTMSKKLPPSIIDQRKQGFGTPVSRWLRGGLRPMMEDLLSSERIARRGYFREETVRKLIDDHLEQRDDNSEHIMALLTLEIWHEVFIDSTS